MAQPVGGAWGPKYLCNYGLLQVKRPLWDKTDIWFLWAPTGIGAPRVKGPKEVAPMQTRGPHCQKAHTYEGPIQIKDPYRRCVIPTHKG